jgi:hypothetical protein
LKPYICLLLFLFFSEQVLAGSKSKMLPLRVSANGHYFEKSDGTPFFVAGDTGYFLAKASTRELVDKYFGDCAKRGINVVFMSFVHRRDQPNRLGDYPWENADAGRIVTTPGNNPEKTDEYDYWDHVDYIVDKAEQYNIYLFMMPLFVSLDGSGYPTIKGESGLSYARFLGNRYKTRTNIAYVLGGDHDPKPEHVSLCREFARELSIAANDGKTPDYRKTFCSYLPTGEETSSTWFHGDEWLDFNIVQTHRHFHLVYPLVNGDYNKKPTKPTVMGEPLYEYHSNFPTTPLNIRRQYYQWYLGGGYSIFGHNVVKGFLDRKDPWDKFLDTPGRKSFLLIKKALTSKQWWKLVPDQTIISSNAGVPPNLAVASRSNDGRFAFIYFDSNKPVTLDMSKLTKRRIRARWMNTVDGTETMAKEGITNRGTEVFTPPAGFEDALLILD